MSHLRRLLDDSDSEDEKVNYIEELTAQKDEIGDEIHELQVKKDKVQAKIQFLTDVDAREQAYKLSQQESRTKIKDLEDALKAVHGRLAEARTERDFLQLQVDQLTEQKRQWVDEKDCLEYNRDIDQRNARATLNNATRELREELSKSRAEAERYKAALQGVVDKVAEVEGDPITPKTSRPAGRTAKRPKVEQ